MTTNRITDADLAAIRARASGVDLLALYDTRLALNDRARLLAEVDALRTEAACRIDADESAAHNEHLVAMIGDALDPSVAASPTWPELAIRVWKAREEGRHGREEGAAERAGNMALRARYGARENETMEGFVGRLAREAQWWRLVADAVHDFDHRNTDPDAPRMGDDDVVDIVVRLLRTTARKVEVEGDAADRLSVVRSTTCPECGAAPGSPCLGVPNVPRVAMHWSRWTNARGRAPAVIHRVNLTHVSIDQNGDATVGGTVDTADMSTDPEDPRTVRDRALRRLVRAWDPPESDVIWAVACPSCKAVRGCACEAEGTCPERATVYRSLAASGSPTIFGCRCCGRFVSGWTDGSVAEEGWRTIDGIDGPNALCPTCFGSGDANTIELFREEYPNVRHGDPMPHRPG